MTKYVHTHKLTHKLEWISNQKTDKTKTEPKFLHNWLSYSHIWGMLSTPFSH